MHGTFRKPTMAWASVLQSLDKVTSSTYHINILLIFTARFCRLLLNSLIITTRIAMNIGCEVWRNCFCPASSLHLQLLMAEMVMASLPLVRHSFWMEYIWAGCKKVEDMPKTSNMFTISSLTIS